MEVVDHPARNATFSSTIDEPEAAQAVQHCQDVVVAESVPQEHVSLEVKLGEHYGDASHPRNDAQGVRYEGEVGEDYRGAGHLVVFQLEIMEKINI